MELSISELAKRIGAEVIGNDSAKINAVGPIETALENDATFISQQKYIPQLKKSLAGAVIATEPIQDLDKPQLIVKDVDSALIQTLRLFAPELKPAPEGIDPTAKIADNVKVAAGVSIGAGVVIEEGVKIGQNTIISSGCKIGENSGIGENCRLDSNVVVYHNCSIGNNVIIQSNSVIGSVGFGYSFIDNAHQLIPHNGGVVIEDFVGIGANTCIDRAKFGNTIVGAGTKIDNLVQIGHNVQIGKCCLIVGMVGISGSCKIGDGVIMAGRSGSVDHIEIGKGAIIGGTSLVTSNIAEGEKVFGTPAIDRTKALKIISLTRRLPALFDQLKQITKKVTELENNKK